MPTLRNVTCNIHIDGKPVETYSRLPRCGHIYETYIIAEENKPYTVNLEFGKTGAERHCVWVRVDGQLVNSASANEPKLEIAGSRYGRYNLDGLKAWEYRHLEFKDITAIGDPRWSEKRKDRLENIGKICVLVRRQHGETEIVPDNSTDTYKMFSSLNSIPKKEIKRRKLSHGTGISQEASEFYDATKCSIPRDVEKYDHAIFLFNYTSRAMLRKMGVLPPEQMSIDDDLVGMNMDSLQQEVMRLRKKSIFGWTWWSDRKTKDSEKTKRSTTVEKTKQETASVDSGDLFDEKATLVVKDDEKKRAKRLLCF
ncbi:hypothetical protein TWF281_004377 [Arthrobotrys megalospora]